MFESLAKALAAGLSIWEHKEKTKYVDRLIGIKTDWYEEYNKPELERDLALMSQLEQQLRILVDSFASSVAGANAPGG